MNLYSTEKPRLHVIAGTSQDVDQYLAKLRYDSRSRLAICLLRGQHMQDMQGLYNEMGAALQFPLYFGRNWAALDECLADLEWLPATGYVLVFADAPMILKSSAKEDPGAFFQLLTRISGEWAERSGEGPERGPKSFHVLLHAETSEAEQFAQVVNAAIGEAVSTVPLK